MPNNKGFLPLRKGSKGIPGKNKKKFLGRPLFSWVLSEAVRSNLTRVVVFTDDSDIKQLITKEYHWSDKIEIVDRSDASASDTASTEQGILEYCEAINWEFDNFVLLQATSPFTKSKHINKSMALLEQEYDSVLSVVRTHRFIWNEDGTPINYNPQKRPRRQDFKGLLVENGALYASTQKALMASKCRVSGEIGVLEMPEESYVEIDSLSDWQIAEQLMANTLVSSKEFKEIKYLVLDVDGVFTPGTVHYNAEGEMAKAFDMRDGMGLELIRESGVNVMVITSEQSEIVKSRMTKLKITSLHLGVKDKFGLLQNFVDQQKLQWENLAYVGDDVNDLAAMCRVAVSLTPNNATLPVKQQADVILNKASGQGAIREACDWITNYNRRFK